MGSFDKEARGIKPDRPKNRIVPRQVRIEGQHLRMLEELAELWGCNRSEALRTVLRYSVSIVGAR